MWIYEKKLQFPVKIKTPNPTTARIIISQLGGPDGELAASMRYLNQRFSMPHREIAGILTDVGTEESKRHLRRSKNSGRKKKLFRPLFSHKSTNSFLSLSSMPSLRSLLISADNPLRSTSR